MIVVVVDDIMIVPKNLEVFLKKKIPRMTYFLGNKWDYPFLRIKPFHSTLDFADNLRSSILPMKTTDGKRIILLSFLYNHST